jgi:5'-3' exonuclease
MQIGMLRDYLDLEFKSAYGKEWPFPYCLERLIDDFVLLCMLVCVSQPASPLEPLLHVRMGRGGSFQHRCGTSSHWCV